MSISRRAFLRATSSVVLATTAASSFAIPAIARVAAPAIIGINEKNCRTLVLECMRSGERVTADYWVEGRYVEDELKRINKALRDVRSGEVHEMDPKLLDLVHHLGRDVDARSGIQVVSGYRSPATNAMLHKKSSGVAEKSLHMEGQAIDLLVPGRSLKHVHDAALKLGVGGVGYYPKSHFVHVDTGRVRRWTGA
jgi:uncharacterized protein YcbK (DUF882 family)